MAPRRFLNGVSDLSSSAPFGNIHMLDPRKYSVYFQDFTGPLLAAATAAAATVVEAGISIVASTNATASVTTDAGAIDGALKFTTTAADNEQCLLQTPSGGFTMTSGKKFFMEAKFEITHVTGDIAQNEIFIGLATFAATTSFYASDGTARTFDDGIGWDSPDATADLNFIVGVGDAYDTTAHVSTYATATWYTLGIYYDGTTITLYTNGVAVKTLTPDQIPTTIVGPTIYMKTGEAKVHTLLVDYLLVVKERS